MEEPEGGVALSELKLSLNEVRSKKALAKMNHKLKSNNRITQNKKQLNLSEMTADLEAKGYDVNKESLRSR